MPTVTTIRSARAALGLTQFEVAVMASISLPTVQAAERTGQWPAQRRTRQALARALGLAVDPVSGAALQGRAGIPIDTPAQAAAVLADRGHLVPQEA